MLRGLPKELNITDWTMNILKYDIFSMNTKDNAQR